MGRKRRKSWRVKSAAGTGARNTRWRWCAGGRQRQLKAFYDGDRFLTIQDGVQKATPLLLTLAVIELSDIAFAIDSIPAVFGVTRDPFVVFTSNMFAILGLRSLYILISESVGELEYLQPAIAAVLGFIGSKMISDYFGYHISTEASLGVVATTLGAGVLLSLVKKSND